MLKPIKNADGNIEIRDFRENQPPSSAPASIVLATMKPDEAIDFFNELDHLISEGKG